MINHKYKFIFIHIPRTGGSSIEYALCNRNWWKTHPPSKHLTAHIAKKIYAPYWDDYFKFSFVRNPWDRMVSMLRYGSFYGLSLGSRGEICTDAYFNKFKKIEYDYRFFNENQFEDLEEKHNSVYMNILGEEMNFIGKFENLQEDLDLVCDLIKIKNNKLKHLEKSQMRLPYQQYYNNFNKSIISKKYEIDIKKFNYSF